MVELASRYAVATVLVVAQALLFTGAAPPALGAISPTGNVLPAYPGTNPDPWNVGTELLVGDSAMGALVVTGGSDVASVGGTAGFDPDIIGSITVSGAGSTWTNSQNLLLGVFGIGKLDVLQGAHVENQDASIGNLSGVGQVTVSDTGSIWTNATDLIIGEGGVGLLSIESGGRVRSADATIALQNDSSGSVTIDGQQSTWEVSNTLSVGDAVNGGAAGLSLVGIGSRLYVGAAAVTQGGTLPVNQTAIVVSKAGSAAQLSIYEGNTVENFGNAYIGFGAGESGTVEVNGESSLFANQGGVSVGVNGIGALNLVAGGTVSAAAPVSVGAGGSVSGVGTVIGTLSNAGIVQPGNAIGALAVEGNYSQSAAGKLRIDLAGTAAGSFDALSVSGQATLGGTLEVDLSGPFVPQLGNAFALVSAMDGLNGTFANADLPTLGAGKMWRLTYSATAATLAVVLAGDYNGNGLVDAADYTVWRDLQGKTLDPRADGNTDGVINLADYDIWKANFGLSAGVGSFGGQAVPEPVIGCLLVPIALAWMARRRSRSNHCQ